MPLQFLLSVLIAGLIPQPSGSPSSHRPLLHTTRQFASDLEISGLVEGLAPGKFAFIRYIDLLRMPQTHATLSADADHPGAPLHISGVSLEILGKLIHPLPQSDLIDATCTDRYRSHFPSQYILQHNPILVLTINGETLATWARLGHHYDPSPYTVMYPKFIPAFQVLSHTDRAQLPDNLIRLNFSSQAVTFGAITPRHLDSSDAAIGIGFTVAKQNCLRCHFMGSYGGTKSGHSWQSLGQWAHDEPEYFKAYIHNPKALDPHARMEPQPEYDSATLAALTAYFQTFAETARR